MECRYSHDGGDTWLSYTFSSKPVQVYDIVTQLDETLPLFLVYGTSGVRSSRSWSVYFVNMTNVLGEKVRVNDLKFWEIPSTEWTIVSDFIAGMIGKCRTV